MIHADVPRLDVWDRRISAFRLIGNYFHTIRYLRPIQVYGQLRSQLYKPQADMRPAPELRAMKGPWLAPARRGPSMTGRNTLDLLNRRHEVSSSSGWNDPRHDRLWLYHLHYFDDLNARDCERRIDWHLPFLVRWIEENPPGIGVGWEPYPISVRVVNWIKWALAGNTLPDRAVHSLAIQVRYLARSLEYRLMGNHLLANAKALVFAGIFFTGEEATLWLEKGLRILEKQLREQILEDGGHIERSPMYHSIVLEDLLDLHNISRAFSESPPSQRAARVHGWEDRIRKMRVWLKAMCHPDGQIALFNDACLAGAPSPLELENYAERLRLEAVSSAAEGLTHLSSSGYVRLQLGPAVALLDIGEMGPSYNLGHAHADTLTFELSLFGERFIVNTGTSTYEAGPERRHQRSTAAHNTVEIDGRDSSEMWGAFRVARRAKPADIEITDKKDRLTVRCAHDGYRHLSPPVLHRRTWRLDAHSLQIRDDLEGTFSTAIGRFHFHPQVGAPAPSANSLSRAEWISSNRRIEYAAQGAECHLSRTFYHPNFGVKLANTCLDAFLKGNSAIFDFSWQ